jgi:hypothetical protein
MEDALFSVTAVDFSWSTEQHIPEDSVLLGLNCNNLKSNAILIGLVFDSYSFCLSYE